MSDEALISIWKDPSARDGEVDCHPAGDIRVSASSAAGRRARLLSGATGPDAGFTAEWLTVTTLSQN